eukprot:11714293-Alexandrium_andersonii.AAC.1
MCIRDSWWTPRATLRSLRREWHETARPPGAARGQRSWRARRRRRGAARANCARARRGSPSLARPPTAPGPS